MGVRRVLRRETPPAGQDVALTPTPAAEARSPAPPWPRRARFTVFAAALLGAALMAPRGASAEGALRVAAAPSLIESGLIAHLAPRFRFKTRITLEVVPLDPAAPGAAPPALLLIDAASPIEGRRTPIAERDGVRYAAHVAEGVDEAGATRLVSWLISKAGARAIARFEPESGPRFAPPGAAAAADDAEAAEDGHAEGEALALLHCGRCHVISEKNKYGGIGSTPSFAALRTIPNWRERFASFWVLNPHPSFTQIKDVTVPFDPERPPHIAPIILSLEEAEAIAAYAETIPPKDLGAEVAPQ